MVGLQTLDLAIGVRVPASQPKSFKHLRAARETVDAPARSSAIRQLDRTKTRGQGLHLVLVAAI